MKNAAGKSLVFVIDDDLAFNKLIAQILKKYGLQAETFSTFESAIKRLETQMPALFMIDLNLDLPQRGYHLIQIIRQRFSATVPIFVVSSENDLGIISHSLELGANDYLLKPLDRNILVAKLTSYVNSPELLFAEQNAVRLPEGAVPVSALLGVKLSQIDENGITVISTHFIPKGTVLTVTGPVIDEILGKTAAHILATTISNRIELKEDQFKVFLEFDSAQERITDQVRSWIVKEKKKATAQPS